METVNSYARRLAGYISDASTVRVRTLDTWGQSPSLAKIKEMQDEARKKAKAHDYGPAIAPDEVVVRAVPVIKPHAPTETAQDLIRHIAARFNLSYVDIVGSSRAKIILRVRYLAIAVLLARFRARSARRDVSVHGLVGKVIGGRDRTTIINAEARWPELMARDGEVAKVYAELTAKYAGPPLQREGE